MIHLLWQRMIRQLTLLSLIEEGDLCGSHSLMSQIIDAVDALADNSAYSLLCDSPSLTLDMIQGDDVEAMAQLLRILGLAQWIDKFRQEEIDLNTARVLKDDALQMLGMPADSRLRLTRAVKNLFEPQQTPAAPCA